MVSEALPVVGVSAGEESAREVALGMRVSLSSLASIVPVDHLNYSYSCIRIIIVQCSMILIVIIFFKHYYY